MMPARHLLYTEFSVPQDKYSRRSAVRPHPKRAASDYPYVDRETIGTRVDAHTRLAFPESMFFQLFKCFIVPSQAIPEPVDVS